MRMLGGISLVQGTSEASPKAMKEQSKKVVQLLRALYPGRHVDTEEVRRLIWEAYRSTDDIYGEEEAIKWADGYAFPPEIARRDMMGLSAAHGNLAEFTRRRHAERDVHRRSVGPRTYRYVGSS